MKAYQRQTKKDIKSLFRPSLFWDADEIDSIQHATYIIARVLDYGDIKDVHQLMKIYEPQDIIAALKKRRRLFPWTGKYWAIKFKIPFSEVPCLSKYYPSKQ